jgi:hypothetical protein
LKQYKLREITQSTHHRIDRENGVIRDVRILGATSGNRWRYTPEAIQKARGLYEGIRVNFDHPPLQREGAERSVADRAGWLENVRFESNGLVGDLHLLKADPRSEKVLEAAERRPELLGLSHVAVGHYRRLEKGRPVFEEITRVQSVDIVSDPATTRSLFESRGEPMETQLREEEMAPPAAPEAAAAAPAGPVNMKAGFRAAIMAVVDDESLDTKATVKKIGEILKAQEKIMGGGDSEVAPEPASEEATESLRQKVRDLEARDESRQLLQDAGIQADPAKLKALVAMESTADRQALIGTWPKGRGDKPQSMPLREAQGGEQMPTDAKGFLDYLKS